MGKRPYWEATIECSRTKQTFGERKFRTEKAAKEWMLGHINLYNTGYVIRHQEGRRRHMTIGVHTFSRPLYGED